MENINHLIIYFTPHFPTYVHTYTRVLTVSIIAGKRIFYYLKTRNIEGETGQVAFDDNGDRIYAEYDVINTRDNLKKRAVGSFFYDPVSIIKKFSEK